MDVRAARMWELGRAGLPQRGVDPVDVGRPEPDPRPAEGVLVIERVPRQVGRGEVRGFDAGRTAVGEPDEQCGMGESEVPLDDVAAEHVTEEGQEGGETRGIRNIPGSLGSPCRWPTRLRPSRGIDSAPTWNWGPSMAARWFGAPARTALMDNSLDSGRRRCDYFCT